jgi:hypothetical protein
MSDTAIKAGFARAHARITEAKKRAPSMTTCSLQDALRKAEAFMFSDEPASEVPDFAMAGAAVGELAKRARA